MEFILLTIVFILLGIYASLKLVKSTVNRAFTGDYNAINARNIGDLDDVDYLMGDFDNDSDVDDDDDDSSIGDVIGDITRINNNTDPNDFISGDLDSELQSARFNVGDFMNGGPLKKLRDKKKAKQAKKGKPFNSAPFQKLATDVTNQTKSVDKVGLPQNLAVQKLITNAVRSNQNVNEIEKAVQEVKMLSNTPGGVTSKLEFSRSFITGGAIKISQTNLKISGLNLATAISFWQINYPGLSRSDVQLAPSTGIVTHSFAVPTAGQVTRVLGIFIMLNAPLLSEIQNAEIGITITGVLANGSALNYTGDRMAIFTNNADRKTLIGFIPTIEIKQSLYVTPLETPTALNPIVVTLTGVPEKTSSVCRLAGLDSSEWAAYKNMVGVG